MLLTTGVARRSEDKLAKNLIIETFKDVKFSGISSQIKSVETSSSDKYSETISLLYTELLKLRSNNSPSSTVSSELSFVSNLDNLSEGLYHAFTKFPAVEVM